VKRRRQWHRTYYLLAIFDVLVVALGIFLNHQIIGIHNESIRVNQVWESRLDNYLDLGTLAGQVNAPGNNVFDSRDVASESALQRQALERFASLMEVVRHDLRDLRGIEPRHAQALGTDLDLVDARMAEMVAEARQIFLYLANGRADLAGRRMAAMDRKYAEVNLAVTRSREDVGSIQRDLFAEQGKQAAALRNFEYLIAGFVVLMISCAMGYGHRIKKELEVHDLERAQHVSELEVSGASLRDANTSLTEEIAVREEAQARLRVSEERYALVARGANDGLWDSNLQSGEVYYSPRWKALLGYLEDELGTRPGEWFDRVHPNDLVELRAHLESAGTDGTPFEIEHRVLHRDGGYRWMLARGIGTRTDDGCRRLVGSHSDVTARKEAELNLVHDSLHDALTGLPNRALFLERLDHALQRAQRRNEKPYGVVYVDLDHFKGINDSLGHLAGDEVLVSIAKLLRQIVRPGDTAARLGGDEFALLLEDIGTEAEAMTVAQRILVELRKPLILDGLDIHVSASIGIAMGQPSDTSTTEVLRRADAALYSAKRDGRGRLQTFEPTMSERVFGDLRLEIDLRGALARNELYVVYQAIVALKTEDLVGVEALLRWNHPSLGLVPPSIFIPIAEESGDIVAIGNWVLREACAALVRLRDTYDGAHSISVSVNVSSRQLLMSDFSAHVQAALFETGLSPDCLRLEITESSIMRNPEQAIALLRDLRELGVRISIDDFGTGHSALSYLHDLPVDCLKIDRSFVNRLTTSTSGAHIVRAIVDLAHNTGLVVVAEGIETKEQQVALRELGCEYGQGYLLGRPGQLAELEWLLEDPPAGVLGQMATTSTSSLPGDSPTGGAPNEPDRAARAVPR
jgi:diguanylate cyclase (GGDEF)-like protein/PAS domain S-box-containing protein